MKQRTLFCSSILAISFCSSFAHANVEKAFESLCKGGGEAAYQELKASKSASDFEVRNFSLHYPNLRQKELDSFKKYVGEPEKLSFEDRAILASALLATKYHDTDKLKKLLDFKSPDAKVESERLHILGSVAYMESKYQDYERDTVEASAIVNHSNPAYLMAALSAIDRNKTKLSEQGTKIYRSALAALPKENAYTALAKSLLERIEDGDKNLQSLGALHESAYKKCPNVEGFQVQHATELYRQNKYDDARSAYFEILKKDPTGYSTFINLALANIDLHLGSYEEADVFLGRAREDDMYISDLKSSLIDAYARRLNIFKKGSCATREEPIEKYAALTAVLSLLMFILGRVSKRNRVK